MATVKFTLKDTELLYSFPKTPSDLATIVRWFMFINRVALPSNDDLASCLSKLIKTGILIETYDKFVLDSNWYAKVHASDGVVDNEIESMLEFGESFVGREFPEILECVKQLSRKEYDALVGSLQ